jgi:predicted alpha/beta-hydrolase family hydrolase
VLQLGRGGWTPRPRNEKIASAMIAVGIETVACTSNALTMLGKMAGHHARVVGADRAAAVDVLVGFGGEHEAAGEEDVERVANARR